MRHHLGPGRFALLLVILLAVSFPDVLVGGHSFFYRDYGVLAYPTVFHYRANFWQGDWPLWNPLSHCGVPFLAQWGTMTLYPGALLYLLLPLPWSLGVFCLGHLFLAGLGMYCLARRWTDHPAAAALAGVLFAGNGLTLSCLLWPNYTVALGWMPWVVLGVERGWREGGWPLLWGTAVAALQWLAGVPEIMVFTGLVLAALWLVDCWRQPALRARLVWRAALMLGLTLGLTAVQLLPFYELLTHSQRRADFATAKWALPSWGWVNLGLPLFRCFQTTQGLFFQIGQEFFSSIYLGLGAVILSGWALWRPVTGRVVLLAGVALAGVALALGDNGPLYPVLRWAVPIAGVARYPVKFLLLTMFAVSLLAAFATARWCQGAGTASPPWRPLLIAGAVLVVGCGLALVAGQEAGGRGSGLAVNAGARILFAAWTGGALWALARSQHALRFNLATLALCLGVWLDFQTHLPRQNPTLPAAFLRAGLLEFAAPRSPAAGRVFITPEADDTILRSRVAGFAPDFVGKRLALWSNLNLLEGVPKVNGASTLQIREQAQIQALLYALPAVAWPRLLDFLGVSYASSPTNVVGWQPRSTALPLITAGQRPLFVSSAEATAVWRRADFDPTQFVGLPEAARALTTVTQATSAQVRLQRFSAHRIDCEVQAQSAAWVVIAQSFYPAWQAEVNGRPARLWPANGAFQAVEAPAGRSQVRLTYRDVWFRGGAVISLCSLGAWSGLAWRYWRRGGA